MNEITNKRTGIWKNVRTNQWTNERGNEWMATWKNVLAVHFQQRANDVQTKLIAYKKGSGKETEQRLKQSYGQIQRHGQTIGDRGSEIDADAKMASLPWATFVRVLISLLEMTQLSTGKHRSYSAFTSIFLVVRFPNHPYSSVFHAALLLSLPSLSSSFFLFFFWLPHYLPFT